MENAILLIRLGTALVMIVFGLEQIIKPAIWIEYIPLKLRALLPTSPETSMRVHSLGNLIIGLWLLLGFAPVVGAWVAIIWWLSILPFAFWHNWRVGLRDLSITLSLVAMLLLINAS